MPFTEHGRSLHLDVFHVFLELGHTDNHLEKENHFGDCGRSEYLGNLSDLLDVLC